MFGLTDNGNLLKGLKKVFPPTTSPQGGQGRRVLRKGMSGMDVTRVQNLLNKNLAYSPPPLWVDGIFGAITDRRVREFQMKKRLEVDGIVGGATWAALEGQPVGMFAGIGEVIAKTLSKMPPPNQGGMLGKALSGALSGSGKLFK